MGKHELSDNNSCEPQISNPQNTEDIFELTGGFGFFQVCLLFLILFFEIPAAILVFAPVFVGATPEAWTCDSISISKSNICSCNGTLEPSYPTFVSDFQLICNLSWVSDFITSIQMIGLLLGNGIFGQFSDWYGRKSTHFAVILCMLVGTLMSAEASNVYFLGGARFLCGVGYAGFRISASNYAMEFMTPKWRPIVAAVTPFGEGVVLMAVLGYYFQHSWRLFLLVSAIPFAMILIFIHFTPESPRWLMRKERYAEAHKVFKCIARVNRKPSVEVDTIIKVAVAENEQSLTSSDPNEKNLSYWIFFQDKELRYTTLCLMGAWGATMAAYFGISFNIKNLEGDRFWNVVWLGLCDVVGYPTFFLVALILDRRKTLAVFMAGSALFLSILAILQLVMDVTKMTVLILTLSMLGKACSGASRAALKTVTGESYPTGVRNMGFAIVGMVPCVVNSIAPQIAYLGSQWPSIPLFIFGVVSLFGGAVGYLLVETKGKNLSS